MLCQRSLGCHTARCPVFPCSGCSVYSPSHEKLRFSYVLALISQKFDTRTMYLTKFQVGSLYPPCFRLVTSILALQSRPEGRSPVKAMKTDVCAGKLDSGQTTRHN